MVYGFGIYDCDVNKNVKNNIFYGFWARMIERCYSEKSLKRHPTYIGTIVCDDWKYFSKFEKWAIDNYVTDSVFDKDIIDGSSKIYSPNTCAFVPQELNKCILDRSSSTKYPLGVWYKKKSKGMINERKKPYQAEIVKYGKSKKLGSFATPEEAHKIWQEEKIIYFIELIEKYKSIVNEKVIDGLKRRIDILQKDINCGSITLTINKV